MACRECGGENRAGAKFCASCGAALSGACPACGAAALPGQRFCDECGAALDGAEAAGRLEGAAVASAQEGATDGRVAERRVCSVMFCDLVGFTTLSETRDPEEVRELLSRYFGIARTIVGRYGGTIEKFIGDAVMAVWGAPVAREEDAERAVRAALDLVSAVGALGAEVGADLAARAGVVTGMVAVTVGATGEGMVAGDAVNTAARVQTAAAAGTVLVDEATRAAAEAAVQFARAGEHTVKGKAEPLTLWRAERVLGGVGGSQRIDGLEAAFVGREAELRLVKELFHACAERRSPRLVSVSGAAGVGKSRLGWEFEKYVDGLAETVVWHRGRCLPYGDGVAFWALGEMVRQRLQIAEDDSPAVAADRLAAGLEGVEGSEAELDIVRRSLAQLLGTGESARDQLLAREELFAGWRLFFERLAAEETVVMLIEDLHHADAGMLDFVEHLLEWARDVPIFLMTFTRPEIEDRRPGWSAAHRSGITLTLDPLGQTAMQTLVESLVPGMPDVARAAIEQRAEGVPLYAVETVRMLIDRDHVQPIDGVYRFIGDVHDLEALSVPATLQSLLAARLDALPPRARELIADAAVLGGTFPIEALIGVSGETEERVRETVAELVRRQVLGVKSDPLSPERGQYGFVQTMLRQVAYDTLARRERKSRHLAVAEYLRQAYADGGEEIAEVIASHLLEALHAVPDDPDVEQIRDDAVAMLTLAGERAARTGALAASAGAFATAAELVEDADGSDAQIAAASLWHRAGKAASWHDWTVAEGHFGRAKGTYERHGLTRDAATASVGIGNACWGLGRLDDARRILREALVVLEPEPQADTVDALSALARIEGFAGNVPESERLSAAALGQAQALDLPDFVIADLLTTRGLAHVRANRLAQASASFREAVRLLSDTHPAQAFSRAHNNLADLLLVTDFRAAVDMARTALAHARRSGRRDGMIVAHSNVQQGLLLTGDWDEVERMYDEGVREDGLKDEWGFADGVVLMRSLRGDQAGVDALMPLVEESRETDDTQDLALSAMCRAAAAWCRRDFADAVTHAQRVLSYVDAVGISDHAVRSSWPIAADAALARDDRSTAAALVAFIEDRPIGHVPLILRADRTRIRARLLALDGDSSAREAFAAATKAYRDFGSPYHLAVGLLDEAEHLHEADPSASASLAAEAATIFESLRVDHLRQRAVALSGTAPATAVVD